MGPRDFSEAMHGCGVVLHTASPFILGDIEDPERNMLLPAVQGTLNVMRAAAASPTVTRVVLTSSTASVYMKPNRGDAWIDEKDWSDSSELRGKG